MVNTLNHIITEFLIERVRSGLELGCQVAAYVDGELVVDTWAGSMSAAADSAAVDGDTLFSSWSTTKGFTATCLHILADRKQIRYHLPVAHYWPEFGAKGKDRITVAHALSHTAGVPLMPEQVDVAMIADWDAMCDALAQSTPLWPAGANKGYHAWTFGWLIGELVRRVDGRPIAQFAAEELCAPTQIDGFFLGIADETEARVATLVEAPDFIQGLAYLDDLGWRAMPLATADTANDTTFRRASVPGGGGIMNARAIARHYAMLANNGVLDNTPMLSAETVTEMRTLQNQDTDLILQFPTRMSMGYFLGGDPKMGGAMTMGASGDEFGHAGLGGSIGFADPNRNFALGLTKNLMSDGSVPNQTTAYLAAEIIRSHIDSCRR